MEELRSINRNGYTRDDLRGVESNTSSDNEVIQVMQVYGSFTNGRIEELIKELGHATRVDGAQFMLLSKPTFISGLYSAFDVVIDRFEDAEVYRLSLYFLIRMAMYMHSTTLQ